MTNFEIIPMVINASVCFTTSIMLLTIKSYSEMGSKPFERIKQLLACCGLLETLHALMVLACEYTHTDMVILYGFIHPVIFYTQLCVVTIGLLGLVHSKKFTGRRILLLMSPVILLIPVHIISYLIDSGFTVSMNTYVSYFNTETAYVIYRIMDACEILESLVCIYFLITETRKYRHQLVNVFSDKEVINGRKLAYLVYGFLGYFLLLLLGSLIYNEVYRVVFFCFIVAIFLAGVIVLFNIQDMYSRVMLVEDYMQKPEEKEKAQSLEDQNARLRINQKVIDWESKTDKPYLKENLTLVDVALEMGIQPYELSQYLSETCKMSFNQWIGIHRMDEAVRLMSEHKEMTMAEVALASGFRNEKSMTKMFRSVSGKSPSEF
jgi:AraC-like DNA-binding protein